MDNKFNVMPNDLDKLHKLLTESIEISNEMSELSALLSGTPNDKAIKHIQSQFTSTIRSYKKLQNSLLRNASHLALVSQEKISKARKHRTTSEKKVRQTKRKISEKESSVKAKQRYAGKSLTRIRHLWKENLDDMEKRLSTQKISKSKLEESIGKFDSKISEEMDSIINMSFLERQKKLALNEEAEKEQEIGIDMSKVNISDVSNYSFEFEEIMKEIDRHKPQAKENAENMSIEKSLGGWKNEYDSEPSSFLAVNPSEIKFAIGILEKANLLNPQNSSILSKLTDLIRQPENSQQLTLLLKIMNFCNNPQTSSAVRDSIESQGCLNLEQLSKESFIFPEDPLKSMKIASVDVPNSFVHSIEKIKGKSESLDSFRFEETSNIPFFAEDMKFANSESVNNKPIIENYDDNAQKELLRALKNLSPRESKTKPSTKQIQGTLDYQSTGISSQSGLKSRITLKTVGSENSQKVFTPGSKSIEVEAFKDM